MLHKLFDHFNEGLAEIDLRINAERQKERNFGEMIRETPDTKKFKRGSSMLQEMYCCDLCSTWTSAFRGYLAYYETLYKLHKKD